MHPFAPTEINDRQCWLVIAFVALSAICLSGCTNKAERQAEPALTDADALIAAGRDKSRICVGCHGPGGVSRIPAYPSLAGLPQEYISEQLFSFRSGKRNNPMMSSVALSLDDADIAALSHFYASLSAPTDQENRDH